MNIAFVALDCPSCGSALKADSHDILFLCNHCGCGAVLDDDGIRQMESTALMPAAGRRATTWRPGWMLEADVTVDHRIIASGSLTEGSRRKRRFVIPAFPLPLADLNTLVKAMIRLSPSMSEIPREPIRGGTLALEDAVTLVRHILVGEEVNKRDKLASVMVEVAVTSQRLVAMGPSTKGSARPPGSRYGPGGRS